MLSRPATQLASVLVSLGAFAAAASATPPSSVEATLASSPQLSVERGSEASHWQLTARLDFEGGGVPQSATLLTSILGAERQAATLSKVDGHWFVSTSIPVRRDLDGEVVSTQIQLWFGPAASDEIRAGLYFAVRGEALVSLSNEEHWRRVTERDSNGDEVDALLTASKELAALPPWDNPALRPEDRALAAALRPAIEEPLGTVSAPLTASNDADPSDQGCHAGHGATAIALAGLALVLVRRRRTALLGLAVVTAGISVSSSAKAKVAYGYAAFWDTRTGSNASGSRLALCTTSNKTCGPADGDSCCFRGIPHVTVLIRQNGALYGSAETTESGFFMIELTPGYDPTDGFDFFAQFDRFGEPGRTKLCTNPTGPGCGAYLRILNKLELPFEYNYIPRISANLADDPNSIAGDIATVWHAVTFSQILIGLEGDWRYRQNYGGAWNDPDDLIVVGYTAVKTPEFNCTNAQFNTYDLIARTLTPHELMGFIYHGRVVGCDATVYQLGYNYPAFPPNPGARPTGDAVAEGVRHAHAYGGLITLLSRWNPNYAAHSSVATTLACVADANANSNDAVGKNNNARALWEFIDTDTSGANGGTDSNSITLTQLMDGLHYFKQQIGGTPGINRKANEPIFTISSVECLPPTLNENCAPGEACIQTDGGYRCYSGDPHGANIADLANVLNAYYGGGLGSFTLTLSSSDCLGSDDDGHPFVGGYRWD